MKDGLPLAKLAKPILEGDQVAVSFFSALKVIRSELLYTRDEGLWPKRKRGASPAMMSGSKLSATVPDGASVVFFNLYDERDLMISSEFIQIK
ncbi:hypothetical protein N8612_02505 [Verrucomicrobia bacterium]|nr:hypothetical protein [Verrucomicrobiota bacterium]